MARLPAGTKRAPSPDKEAKPHRRVWPPPERKERSLGKLDFHALVDHGLIDKQGRLVENRGEPPITLGELARQDGKR